jgi:hypothetical protein
MNGDQGIGNRSKFEKEQLQLSAQEARTYTPLESSQLSINSENVQTPAARLKRSPCN